MKFKMYPSCHRNSTAWKLNLPQDAPPSSRQDEAIFRIHRPPAGIPLHGGCGNLLSARGFQPLPVPALAALWSLSNARVPLLCDSFFTIRLDTCRPTCSHSHGHRRCIPADERLQPRRVWAAEPLRGRGAAEGDVEARPVDNIVAHTCIASFRQPLLRNIISIDKFVYFPAFHSAAVVTRPLTEQCSSFIRSYGNIIQ